MKLSLIMLATGLFFSFSAYATETISEPYSYINELPFDPQGWFGNAGPLQTCLQKKPAHTIIEVGSWLGTSTRFIAQIIPEDGKVYAIDTWAGTDNEPVMENDPRLPYLYQLFLSNIKHAKLTEKIIPIRMKSLEAAKAINVMADLIYIDAAHTEEDVYQDIIEWSKHLVADGVMCGDDWSWPSVRKGVIRASEELGTTIRASNNFWWFE